MASRRTALLHLLAFTAAGADAQEAWPVRPVRIVVPFPAGGPTDQVGRIVANALSAQLQQSVVVDNRSGAGGAIGVEHVVRSAPDGYTLLVGSIGPLTILPALQPKLAYRTASDLRALGWIGAVPHVLVVRADSPYQRVDDVIRAARAGQLAFGSGGSGTTQHLMGVLFEQVTGTRLMHVPYKGAGPALQDLMAGVIPLLFDTTPGVAGALRSGQLRALAISSRERHANFPSVPTFQEIGLGGLDVEAWLAVLGPARLPDQIVARISDALGISLRQPQAIQSLQALGLTTSPRTAEETREFIGREIQRWDQLVRSRGITAD